MEDLKRKLLIVGAGVGQVPLCLKAKRSGLYVIVVSIPGDYPCFALADKCYFQDIFDKEAVLEIAIKEKIDAIISDQNDLMMPTVAYVAEHLNLPGNTQKQVEAYSNKNKFRGNCDVLQIPIPRHIKVCSDDIPASFLSVPFPWVVKPEDSQSSIGVTKVADEIQCREALRNALHLSRNNAAIVEEYVDGREVVCEGFIADGHYYNLGIADRRYFRLDNLFIPSQTIFPSTLSPDVCQQIVSYEQQYAAYIHPSFAIVHSEYLIDEKRNKVYVVESALRGGGVYISSHLVPLYAGIDINDILLDYALGKHCDHLASIFSSMKPKAAAYVCFYLSKGVIRNITGIDEIQALSCVKKCNVEIRAGETTKPMRVKGQRLGPIILQGDNRVDIEEKIRRVQSMLKIDIENEDRIINGIIWE